MRIIICFVCFQWLAQNDAGAALIWLGIGFTIIETLQLVANEINGFYAARLALRNDEE